MSCDEEVLDRVFLEYEGTQISIVYRKSFPDPKMINVFLAGQQIAFSFPRYPQPLAFALDKDVLVLLYLRHQGTH